jgi:hypothetical protein
MINLGSASKNNKCHQSSVATPQLLGFVLSFDEDLLRLPAIILLAARGAKAAVKPGN